MIEDPRGVYTEEVALLEVADNRLLAMVRCHRPEDRLREVIFR